MYFDFCEKELALSGIMTLCTTQKGMTVTLTIAVLKVQSCCLRILLIDHTQFIMQIMEKAK